MAGNERGPQNETRDVNAWAVGRFLLALVAIIGLCIVLLFGLFRYFETVTGGEKPVADEHVNAGKKPPEPRLETAPVPDLRKLREAEEKTLTSYGWVDRKNGVVRIPVARAIDLLAERGLPARPAAPASTGVSVPTESGLGPKMMPAGGPLAGEGK